MPDDRLFHKKLGHSEKVNSLTADEEIVWRTYIQAADDFGVMMFTARPLQDAHDRLGEKPSRAVVRMLERVADVGLVRTFTHQRRTYCYQHDWQDYQKIRFPDQTIHPRIPDLEILDCTRATQWLCSVWPGTTRQRKLNYWKPPDDWTFVPQSCAEPFRTELVSDTAVVPSARVKTNAYAQETNTQGGAGGNCRAGPISAADNPELAERAGRFLERYAEFHVKYRYGAHYIGKPNLDFLEALHLVATYDDERLDKVASAFLQSDDDFSSTGTRTIAKLRSRASWCDEQLRKAGL